ncbi:hypothetical protein LIER_35993 [Lithospermum erythrorhizon]|uniref:Uncharacterized protein n=1 Tax=Lithospermum erythrorhizon TaxID=34254 RepID=A0AAV3NZ82_LITER
MNCNGLIWDQLYDPGILVRELDVFVGMENDQMDYHVNESEIEMLKNIEVDYSRKFLGIQIIECISDAYSVFLKEQIIQGSVYLKLSSQLRRTKVLASNEIELLMYLGTQSLHGLSIS